MTPIALIMLLIENYETIFTVLLSTQVLAVAIVNLTPTPNDDKWVYSIYRVLEMLSGIISSKAKQLPGGAYDAEAFRSGRTVPRDSDDILDRM